MIFGRLSAIEQGSIPCLRAGRPSAFADIFPLDARVHKTSSDLIV